jgi:O-antigen ligase
MSAQSDSENTDKRLNKTIAGGLLLGVAFTALAHGAVEPWSVFVFEIIVIALVMLWAAKAAADGKLRIVVPKTALPVAALAAFGLLQSLAFRDKSGKVLSLSMNVGATRQTVTALIFLLASFIIAANFFATRDKLASAANFLIIYGLALAIFALIQNFTWDGKFYWIRPTESPSPFGPFANHNHFAGYMEMLIPLPLGLMLARAARAEMRWLYGFAATMMGVATVVSLSRGGMISLAASMCFILLMSLRLRPSQKRQARPSALIGKVVGSRQLPQWVSRAALLIVIVAVIAAGIFWIGADRVLDRVAQGQPSASEQQRESFFSSRGWVWRDTLTMIRANPILGVGLGAYGTAFPIYTRSDGSLRVPQAHNDFLQIAADCGIPGALLAIWFIALVFRAVARGMKSRDPLLAGLALGAGAGIFAILVHSIFDFNLQLPANALLFLVLSAVASRIAAIVADEEKTSESILRRGSRELEARKASAASLVRGAS